MCSHYRTDRDHGNSYEVWKRLGSPQDPTPEQYRELETSAGLALLESPRWIEVDSGEVRLEFSLPRQGVSLVQLSWLANESD